MSEKPSPLLPDDEQSRDRLRAALAVFCVLAVLLAGTVVPAVSGAGLGQTPLGSAVPTPNVDVGGMNGGGGGGGAAGGGLGALNPGDQTSLGGSLAENQSAFQSQNAEVHFRVRSTSASYWRTGAYDQYTGSGWEQSGDRQPYSGPVRSGGIQGERVQYRVTLGQSATALPSVWRANSVSQSATDSLYVTDQRAFETGDPVPAGTTYSGVSHRPARDPTVLRAAGTDYPSEIERRYTALPEDSEHRVAGFTDRLTAGSSSAYESAMRIESWLESNKNYSLNVSKPSGGDSASEFIFEMEEGYCEYFATSMTVMLRSQDIPARYVVGYSTGQKVGSNTYKVRAMNAHAWVEVYFPEVGWVRFDPTPGQERLQSERRAFQNQTQNDPRQYDHTESGSPGEEFSPTDSDSGTPGTGTATTGGSGTGDSPGTGPGTATSSGTGTSVEDGTPTTGESGESGDSTDPEGTTAAPGETTTTSGDSNDSGDDVKTSSGYDVELNRTPVPGATVEVTVTDNVSTVIGAPVFFNGERVGVTDEGGTVTAQVPYVETLKIRVGGSDSASALSASGEIAGHSGATGEDSSEIAEHSESAVKHSYSSFKTEFSMPRNQIQLSGPPLDSDAVFSLAGPPPTGVNLRPAPTGVKSRSSSLASAKPPQKLPLGNETNGTGYSLATNATLAVSGDAIAGSEVVVTATVRGVPVRNAEVTLGDETVGTTGKNGRVEVRIPDSPGNFTLAVSRGPVEGETTLVVPTLELSTDPKLPLALPGTGVEICATYGGDPISDAQVRVGGANHTTDINGTATASLPFSGSAQIVASARGQTRRTTVSGLFVNLAGVSAAALAALGALGFASRRTGIGPRQVAAALLGAVRALPDLAVAALFGAADRLSWAVERLLDALADLRSGEVSVRELIARFRAWFAERLDTARENSRESLAGFVGDSSPDAADDARRDESYRTLRESWDSFLRVVSVRRPDAMTPGELADHAVTEDDLPPGAVVTLRDAFRDVEYGARSPDDRLPRVEEAIAEIERARREQAERDESADESDGTGATDHHTIADIVGGDD
ncbi:transglutaminaseTgpA domain-containing protein [Halorussus ruber]|uniref:transglutaminaseTgpA domain-containing protein n=1 Tax=Halorussus ruber TaxID=1126238 RepID=UPI00143D21D4|nr:transglutaminaseTgpA domain-containing protein [Halorussus ruber]